MAGCVLTYNLLSEQPIFRNLSTDAAVTVAIHYLYSRATFHLISMTFYRQPSVPSPRAKKEKERRRSAGQQSTDSSRYPMNLVGSSWELQPRSISTRLNLTSISFLKATMYHNSMFSFIPKAPSKAANPAQRTLLELQSSDKCPKQLSVCKQALSINAPGGDEISVSAKAL